MARFYGSLAVGNKINKLNSAGFVAAGVKYN